MPVKMIVGANWGDEGKGKITDNLASQADMVLRFQGGRNAGHTVVNPYGKFVLHLLPSGVFYPHVINLLAPGVAFDMEAFFSELDQLSQGGVPRPQVFVSDRAQVVMPYHVLFDQYEEQRLAEANFGSTQSGIAPFYADKYLKLGIQVGDLSNRDHLRNRLERSLTAKNILLKHLYAKPILEIDSLMDYLEKPTRRLLPFICDTTELIHQALSQKQLVIGEGQLGALRDPDHGIYPYSTSSSTLAGFASVGAGIPLSAIRQVITVTKAYSTCVGAGPFVCELSGPKAEFLRESGGDSGEYGATTGRPRRVGFFDAVATRYGCSIQGATEIALTCLDVLSQFDEIPLCTTYEINGQKTIQFPTTPGLYSAKPCWETVPGWREDISGVRTFAELPENAREYVQTVENAVGVPIKMISIGSRRDAMIFR